MGISWVLTYPNSTENRTPSQILDDLGKLLIGLGFERDPQPFNISCESYQSLSLNPPRSFQVITDSDRPASCFLISDRNPGDNITAERSFLAFLPKMSSAYTTRTSALIEIRGHSYIAKDFIIRPGILTVSSAPKCVIVEAELRVCPVLINALDLMKELFNMFWPTPITTHPQFEKMKLEGIYTAMDTVVQYYDICMNIRRSQPMK